jgi:DNA-binding transcriptional LysR family regulator
VLFDNWVKRRFNNAMKEQIGLDRLTGLIAFAKAASLGSYTAAGRALSVSPSAISKSVMRLEAHLGVKLFSRTTRSLTLTQEGQDLQVRALRLLREVEEIEQAAVAARAEPFGTLKVAAPLPIGVNILAPALPAFRRRYPKLTIDLRLGDQLTDIIDEGIDVAIRVGDLSDSRLISRRLGPHRVGAFASPEYLAEYGRPGTLDDLGVHQCVNFRYQSTGQPLRWLSQSASRTQDIIPEAAIVADVSEAVASILAAGGGIGLTPTYVAAPYLRRGELVPVLPELAQERFGIYALWPQSRQGSPTVRAFLAYLLELFPTPTPWDALLAEDKR